MSLSYSTMAISVIVFMFLSYSTMAFTASHSCLYPIVLWHSLRSYSCLYPIVLWHPMYHIRVSILQYYGIHCIAFMFLSQSTMDIRDHVHVSILWYCAMHRFTVIIFMSISYSTMTFTVVIFMSLSYGTVAFAVSYACLSPKVLWHSLYHIHVSIPKYYCIHCDLFMSQAQGTMAFTATIFMGLSYGTMAFTVAWSRPCSFLYPIVLWIFAIIFMSLSHSTMTFTVSCSCLYHIVL